MTTQETKQICPLCDAHCTSDTISCGRGVRYFNDNSLASDIPVHSQDSAHSHHADQNTAEAQLLHDFNKCAHYLHHRKGVKQGRSKILNILKKEKILTQRELQERLEIRSASLSELLGKMEDKGLIARTPNEFDKRTVDVRLTDEGQKAVKKTEGGFLSASQELFSGLDEDEKDQLASILNKLLTSWKLDENPTGFHHSHRKHHHGHHHHH